MKILLNLSDDKVKAIIKRFEYESEDELFDDITADLRDQLPDFEPVNITRLPDHVGIIPPPTDTID